MSDVLFCYDGPLSKDEDGSYYGSALNDSVFSRYKFFGNKVSIAIRTRKVKKQYVYNKLSKISKDYNIIELPNIKSIKGIIFNTKEFNKKIENSVKNSKFIIIRMPSSAGNVAIKYCKKYKKKYIVEMVGCIWDSLWNYSIKGKIIAPISFLKTKMAIKNASNVIYVTQSFLQKRYPNLNNNIGCSDVCLSLFDDKILNKRYNKIKDMKQNKKIILGTCAALDVKYKGQEYVIKALHKLKQNGFNNFEYQMVGGGSSLRLKKIAEKYGVIDSVNIIGSIDHEKVFDWLDSIDIYIQPSNQEGLSRAIIEAMSRGCPCIVSNAGGNSELIKKEYIFNKKDVKQLSNILKNMVPEKMLKASKENYNNSKKYEINHLYNKRIKFYKDIIDNDN